MCRMRLLMRSLRVNSILNIALLLEKEPFAAPFFYFVYIK